MGSLSLPGCSTLPRLHGVNSVCDRQFPYKFVVRLPLIKRRRSAVSLVRGAFASNGVGITSSHSRGNGTYTVGDFMTKKTDLHVVKPSTTVDEALELLVEKRVTGFPVIDDDWNLVGVVSDYDLLALDSISGSMRKV